MSALVVEAKMPHNTRSACMPEYSRNARDLRGAAVVMIFVDHG